MFNKNNDFGSNFCDFLTAWLIKYYKKRIGLKSHSLSFWYF